MSQEPPPPAEPESQAEGGGHGFSRETVVLLAVMVEGGLLVLATVLGWAFDTSPVSGLAWDGLDALRGVAAALPLIAGFVAAQRWPVGPLKRLQRLTDETVRPMLAPCSNLDLLGISALAGLSEEVLFRGVTLGLLQTWTHSWWAALALSSLLFGLMHAVTLTYAVLATLAGAYLGLACGWAPHANLLIAVVAHALYDFVALLWLLRGPGAQEVPKEEAEKPLGPP